MNLAGLYDLPVIFVLENNRYSMGTSIERGTTMANDLRTKSAAFGIDHAIIDGKDVVSLYKSFKPIADWCRTESRPYFVEAKTYRYKGHSMSDPRKYRTKEEEAFEESNDSIDRFEKFLCDEHGLTSDGIKQMTRQVKSQVREAVLWARESEETSIDEMYTDVFTDNWGPFKGTSKPQMMQGNEE
jgi:pyruvate dehydrogenase E1 component alpha subunit